MYMDGSNLNPIPNSLFSLIYGGVGVYHPNLCISGDNAYICKWCVSHVQVEQFRKYQQSFFFFSTVQPERCFVPVTSDQQL